MSLLKDINEAKVEWLRFADRTEAEHFIDWLTANGYDDYSMKDVKRDGLESIIPILPIYAHDTKRLQNAAIGFNNPAHADARAAKKVLVTAKHPDYAVKEAVGGVPVQVRPDLKKSDSSDAGANDVVGKVRPNDVTFSLMRNTINSDGEITGSDVADYLERAGELNDEVETVPFGLETDDGDIVKVYINAEQADAFAEELKKMLGIEDDIEEAINKLAQDFDIVDVVWPKSENNDSSEVLDIPSDGEFDALDDGDEFDVFAEYDPLKEETAEEPLLNVEQDDPKEPTLEEAAAFRKLNEVVMQLSAQGSSGVAAATGFDRERMTKLEMIAKYVKAKYSAEAALARDWLNRVGESADSTVLPYWLRESLQTADSLNPEGEEDMTIGTQFLKRLSEGKAVEKGPFDSGTEAAKRMIVTAGGAEKNYGDKIAELLNMCGVPGMYIKRKEVVDSIAAKGKALVSDRTIGAAFIRLHGAVKAARGLTMEARNTELTGGAFQQLMEEILVSLGAPVELVGMKAKSGVKTAMMAIARDFASNQEVAAAFKNYARKAGIKITDDTTGATKGKKVDEATTIGTVGTKGTGAPAAAPQGGAPQKIEAGTAAYVEAAKRLLTAFGVPENILKMPIVRTKINAAARKDAANQVSRKLITRLTSELGKRD